MSRITDLQTVLFPVVEAPLVAKFNRAGTTREVEVPTRRALLNHSTGRVVGVVGRDYEVFTNQQALDLGRRCCRQVFPNVPDTLFEVFQVDAPASGSFCHIDLIHRGYVANLIGSGGKAENYVPYLRVTNSYNGLRALRFDVGLCRQLCLNGVIFEQETIQFTFSHTRADLGAEIQFHIPPGLVANLVQTFQNTVKSLVAIPLTPEQSLSILVAVAGLRRPTDDQPGSPAMEDYGRLHGDFQLRVGRYHNEVGDNAYALLNALTDVASRPPSGRCFRRDMQSLQRLAGRWGPSFAVQVRSPGFTIERYLASLN